MTAIEPDADTLKAFGILENPTPLPGGRGLCYVAGDIVLRPVDDKEEAQWVAEVANLLPKALSYCITQPRCVIGMPGTFVYNGWTSSSLLAGEANPKQHFEDILRVSRAFHTDVRSLNLEKPAFLTQRSNRWREADLVTWNEKKLDAVKNVNNKLLDHFQLVMDRLKDIMRPLPENIKKQIIHADLTGNVLFQDGGLPGIIDMTPYWRPAGYAEAIVVADGLAWYGEGEELVNLYGVDELSLQLLIRALHWRCLTYAIDTDVCWTQEYISKADYHGAVSTVSSLLENRHKCAVVTAQIQPTV